MFQSSPGPKTGCNRSGVRSIMSRSRLFQSSPGPKTGCNNGGSEPYRDCIFVSILTRPEDRVQPHSCRQCPRPSRVSILTRPEDRVQRSRRGDNCYAGSRFQSSPGPKTGCNTIRAKRLPSVGSVSILTRPEDRVQHRVSASIVGVFRVVFQSSPGPKTGCNAPSRIAPPMPGFQSSPGPKTGCNKEVQTC